MDSLFVFSCILVEFFLLVGELFFRFFWFGVWFILRSGVEVVSFGFNVGLL